MEARSQLCNYLINPRGMSDTKNSYLSVPNVAMVPIADKEATWDLFLVGQRGKMSAPLRALLSSLQLEERTRS